MCKLTFILYTHTHTAYTSRTRTEVSSSKLPWKGVLMCFTFCCISAVVSEIAKTAIRWLSRTKNMYRSEQQFVSMAKKHIFLQNGSSTLDDISLQNVLAHPAEHFLFFWCSITASWAYKKIKKHQKQQSRWSYRMSWPLKTLTTWTLQNVHLCLLGVLMCPVTKCPGQGASCNYTRKPFIRGSTVPKYKGKSNGDVYNM